MTARSFLIRLCLAAASLLLGGCVALLPNRVTVTCERDESGNGSRKGGHTNTNKVAVAAAYDIHP